MKKIMYCAFALAIGVSAGYSVGKDEEIKPAHNEIRRRLAEHEDPDRELFSEISVKFHNCLCQSFYWRQEDED